MKLADFENDVFKLRDRGLSFEKIALWLATEKNFAVTPQGVRAFLQRQEIKRKAMGLPITP